MSAVPGAALWPVELRDPGVPGLVLRPIRRSDKKTWYAARERNRAWLERWDATSPAGAAPPQTFGQMLGQLKRAARRGQGMPFVLEIEGRLAGQVTVNNVVRGSAQFASVGYWIDEAFAGRGYMPMAVAMVIDHCLFVARLHRIEVAIRPENTASLRVLEKLGLKEYGYAPRFLHIHGDWRDHRLFQVTREEVGSGLVARLAESVPLADEPQ